MIIVVDFAVIEIQEYHILEYLIELPLIHQSHLDFIFYFILSLSLIMLGLFISELINWLVTNT